MATVQLLFAGRPLAQPANLVFGAGDAGGVISDATVSGSITLARPTLSGRFVPAPSVGGSIKLVRPTMTGAMAYFTDTARPLVAHRSSYFQDGLASETGWTDGSQDSSRLQAHSRMRFKVAPELQVSTGSGWDDAGRRDTAAYARFQDAIGIGTGADVRYQDATGVRNLAAIRAQDGTKTRASTSFRYQDATGVRNSAAVRFQGALTNSLGTHMGMGDGRFLEVGRTTRYQAGIRPPPGQWSIPVSPAEDPCYVPDADLLFAAAWSSNTGLVFLCERHGSGPVDPVPGETVVVPIRRVYVVLNSSTLRRVDGDIALPTYGMTLALDTDSWTWTFSASLPGRALPDVKPNSDGDPVEVEAVINGVPYRMLIENIGRDRAFASDGLRVSGRGINAVLDAPYAAVQNFGNTSARSAQQLMGDVLTINGVSMGWTVDWQIADWTVPGGIWAKQGTYIEALNEIVAAAGGYLQPDASTKTLHALLRYPSLPRDWANITPDYELPSAVTSTESTEWVTKPDYNRVYVSGVQGGVRGNVVLSGTAGDLIAPMVTDSLITDAIAARQRGLSVLADTGRIANYSLRLPVLPETGIIPPGKFVRYVDDGVSRIGLTRSVGVDIGRPDVWQTLLLETHE